MRLIHRRTSPSIRLNVKGYSIRLGALRRAPTGLQRWLLILGPGLIATCAGNDAGGIATYSQAGATYGYSLIWVMILITVSLAVVQEMCARLGAASGRGLLDLIREQFGVSWSLFAVGVILLANGAVIVTEFLGIGAASELFGLSKFVAVPLAAVALWYLVIFGSYARVEKAFILMTLVFFAYPIAAIMGHPNWHQVFHGAFVPSVPPDAQFDHAETSAAHLADLSVQATHHKATYYGAIFMVVALIGTTITPYMQLFQQSALVERGVSRDSYGPERADAYIGSIFSNMMSIFMMIATAATLHVIGDTSISSAADAAVALEPLAGHAARQLFGIGLLGASLLAGAVLPLTTAYAISETFGIPGGVNQDRRNARLFFALFTTMIVMGAVLSLIPSQQLISLLVNIQVLNGALIPIILVFILKLVNDRRITGHLKNTPLYNVLGWGTFWLITLAVIALFGMQALQALSIIPSS